MTTTCDVQKQREEVTEQLYTNNEREEDWLLYLGKRDYNVYQVHSLLLGV